MGYIQKTYRDQSLVLCNVDLTSEQMSRMFIDYLHQRFPRKCFFVGNYRTIDSLGTPTNHKIIADAKKGFFDARNQECDIGVSNNLVSIYDAVDSIGYRSAFHILLEDDLKANVADSLEVAFGKRHYNRIEIETERSIFGSSRRAEKLDSVLKTYLDSLPKVLRYDLTAQDREKLAKQELARRADFEDYRKRQQQKSEDEHLISMAQSFEGSENSWFSKLTRRLFGC